MLFLLRKILSEIKKIISVIFLDAQQYISPMSFQALVVSLNTSIGKIMGGITNE